MWFLMWIMGFLFSVCPRLISSILDMDKFSPMSHISVLQFKLFFDGHENPDSVICEFAADSK